MAKEISEQYEQDCARALEITQMLRPSGGWCRTESAIEIDNAAHNLIAFGCNSDDVESAFRAVVEAVVMELGQQGEWELKAPARTRPGAAPSD